MTGWTDFVCLALLNLASASQCCKVYSLEYKLLILVCTGMCMDNRVSDVFGDMASFTGLDRMNLPVRTLL